MEQSYQPHRYENGLELVIKHADDYDNACVMLGLRMGSLFEEDGLAGAAHFVEHMFFQTPARGSKRSFHQRLEWHDVDLNAETLREGLLVKMTCPPRNTDIALSSLFNAVTTKSYSLKDFAVEREHIMREISECSDSARDYVDYFLFRPALFQGTPLQKQVRGTEATVRALTAEGLFAYKQQFFYPENMVLVVVGNFNEKKIFEQIDDTFATLPTSNKEAPKPATFRPRAYPKAVVEDYRSGLRQSYIRLGWRVPGYTHEDQIVLSFLTNVLGDYKSSSRLGYTLGIEHGYSYVFGTDLITSPNIGCFSTHLAINPQREKEALAELKGVYRNLSTHRIKRAELEGIKARMLSDVPPLEEEAKQLFQQRAYQRKYDLLSDAYRKRIERITASEVLAVAREHFSKRPLTAILRPQ